MPGVMQDELKHSVSSCCDESNSSCGHEGQNHSQMSCKKKRKYGKVDKHDDKQLLMPATACKTTKRFSQACDRCRMKKIKCDGLKPSCTACKKIGYHCTTSDKLTRRGFPRGYTEMLENEVVKLQRLCGLTNESGETVLEGTPEQLNVLQATLNNVKELAARGNAELSPAGQGSKVASRFPAGQELKSDVKPAPAAETSGPVTSNTVSAPETAHNHDVGTLQGSEQTAGLAQAAGNTALLPFINDTFHKFPNYIHDQVYLGNFSWNCIINANKPYLKSLQYNRSIVQDPILSFVNRHFPLSPSGVPINIPLSVDDLIRLIDKYLNSNQIFPYILGTSWNQRIMAVLTGTSTVSDPAVSIVLILIVQFELNCFNNETIFQAVKLLGSLSQDKLSSIQLVNLGIRYFMSQDNPYSVIWTNDLINFNQYMIINSGLFLNYNNLVGHEKSTSKTIRLLTFYQFQVFQIWWSFINGLPKTNFLIDEFQPPQISEFPSNLKMFQLVYEFVLQMDGCHLQILANEVNNKYQLLIESFGYKLIYQWKLYHHLQDHDFKQIQLDSNDMLEIGITLIYLVCRYVQQPTSVELAYEIISLYWLILSDNSNVKPINSRILKTIQFMPLNNKQLIESCLLNLLNEPKETYNWYKYKKLLKRWVTIWMDESDIFSRLTAHYQLSIGMTDISPTVSNFKPMEIAMDPVSDSTNLFKIYDVANNNIIDDEGYEEDNESDYNELIIMPKRRSMVHHPAVRASSVHKAAAERSGFSLFHNKIDHTIS